VRQGLENPFRIPTESFAVAEASTKAFPNSDGVSHCHAQAATGSHPFQMVRREAKPHEIVRPPWDRLRTPIIYPMRPPIHSAWSHMVPQLGAHKADETTEFRRNPSPPPDSPRRYWQKSLACTAHRQWRWRQHGHTQGDGITSRMVLAKWGETTRNRAGRGKSAENPPAAVGRNCSNLCGLWGSAENPIIYPMHPH